MTTKDILNLDFRKKESQEILQKALRRIKKFSEYDKSKNIPIEDLEKMAMSIQKKYKIRIQWITPTFPDVNEILYTTSIRNDENYKFICNVYALSLYELLAKVLIVFYTEVKKGELAERTKRK